MTARLRVASGRFVYGSGITAQTPQAGITMKLKRGTFAATFFLACLAAMELEGVVLEEI
jgi:hypothetical protein